jgi:hypothetical protein
VIAPQREAAATHALRTDTFKHGIRVDAAYCIGEHRRREFSRCFAGREKIAHY